MPHFLSLQKRGLMNEGAPNFCRDFASEIEKVADLWFANPVTTDTWQATGKTWGSESQPYEVSNQNNLRGVAKPGLNRPVDITRRAANEKIASDLAYLLNLPLPPIVLWDRGDGVNERYASISAWAFENAIEWPHARAGLSKQQLKIASRAAGAMQLFDTWVAAQDRKDEHLLVRDDADASRLGLAYIDYAYAVSYEWSQSQTPAPGLRPSSPSCVVADADAAKELLTRVQAIEEHAIKDIVNRIPSACFSDDGKIATLDGLLRRRDALTL